MSKTVYIAARSDERPAAKDLAGQLAIYWYSPAHNWWDDIDYFSQHGEPCRASMETLAEDTLNAVLDADLFVFMPSENEHGHWGAWVELGARLAAGKRAHFISNGGTASCFFSDYHPLMVVHDSLDDFLNYVDGVESAPSRGAQIDHVLPSL